jgi:cytochrome P450
LFVTKCTTIDIPLARVNTSEALWGPNAEEFDPGRWLGTEDEKKGRKEKVKGYRNLLTFAYGPRMCPGRNYAVTELKVRQPWSEFRYSF